MNEGAAVKFGGMKHLVGALQMTAKNGLCIHLSAALVMDVPGSMLCAGTFNAATPEQAATIPAASPVPFIHAWAEYRGKIFAPTLIKRLGGLFPVDAQEYFAINGARDIHRLARPELLRLAKAIGLSAHLRLGKPAKHSVGVTILKAMGLETADDGNGGIVPARSG